MKAVRLSRNTLSYAGVTLILVAAIVGVFLWQHAKVNDLTKQLTKQKAAYSSLAATDKKLTSQLKSTAQSLSSATKVYHIGDTQSGVTLIGMYPFHHQNLMGGNGATPPTEDDLYFALSGVSTDTLYSNSTLLTDIGHAQTAGPYVTIPACGNNPCVGFEIGADGKDQTPQIFIYKNLEWQL